MPDDINIYTKLCNGGLYLIKGAIFGAIFANIIRIITTKLC